MRLSEIRLLRWEQIDLISRQLTVGESKTDAGTGRVVPLNDSAFEALLAWAQKFPERRPEHYVYPSEHYGVATNSRMVSISNSDPTKPTTSIQQAWQTAKARAGVRCRLHDLRHTVCTRMLERGTPISVVAAIFGWSASTMVLMTKRYGHVGQQAKRDAVALLDRPVSDLADGHLTPVRAN